MSAWNVAGAVVWTPTAVLMGWCSWNVWKETINSNPEGASLALMSSWATLVSLAGSAFCIARLCGAHSMTRALITLALWLLGAHKWAAGDGRAW